MFREGVSDRDITYAFSFELERSQYSRIISLFTIVYVLPDWRGTQGVLCRENAGRGLLCADVGSYYKGTGWERDEPGKGAYRSRTFPYIGGCTERRFSEISSPE